MRQERGEADRPALLDGAPIHVIATSTDGTRKALEAASALARGASGRVVLFLRRAPSMPCGGSGEAPDARTFEEDVRSLAESCTPPATVVAVACDDDLALVQLLRSPGVVIIGGRGRLWWPTPEQRLAYRLAHYGCQVTFVHVSPRAFVSPWRAAAVAAALVIAPSFGAAQTGVETRPAGDTAAETRQTARPWLFGAFLDLGYSGDFNAPSNHLFRSRGTTPRVDELNVNMAGAHVRKLTGPASRWGVEMSVHAGQDSKVFGFSATAPPMAGADWVRHFGPTNVSYHVPGGRNVTLQAGIFNSFIGYDSLYARDNLTYSRPWTADFTPYLMLGVSGSFAVREHMRAAVFVVNGYWHLAHANDVPSFGGQVAYEASDHVTFRQTVLYGPHQEDTSLDRWRVLSDSIVERKTQRMKAAFEFQLGTERVSGARTTRALWLAAQAPLHLAVGRGGVTLRPEFCWDRGARWTGFEQSVRAITSTLQYRLPHRRSDSIVRLEHRYDHSRGADGGFFTARGAPPGEVHLTPGQHLLILGWIVSFERR